MVVPSSTFPQRCDVPATWSRDLTSWVLPASPCPITARFLMFSVANVFMTAKSPEAKVQGSRFKVQSSGNGTPTLNLELLNSELVMLVRIKFILQTEKGQESPA